mgnify:CR=1 FL=1
MEVVVLLLFIGIVLAACGVGFFAWNFMQRNHEHGARLALLPLDSDDNDNSDDNWNQQ